MKNLQQKLQFISAERRKKIEIRTAALIVEEMTLQKFRQARKRTR